MPDFNPSQAPLIPVPQGSLELLRGERVNFSLLFPRLMEWNIQGAKLEKPNDVITKLCICGNKSLKGLDPVLQKIHERQKAVLDDMETSGLKPLTIHARSIAPFISGLSSGHSSETGMILDRNTGCPFIPASSIKGVLRVAYALNLAKENPELVINNEVDDTHLRKYFGDMHTKNYTIPDKNRTRGQLVILDAYPVNVPELKQDIMNPHYGAYYEQKGAPKTYVGPVETESPVPIKFLVVGKDCEFVFRCFLQPLVSGAKNDNTVTDEDINAIRAMFDTAFSTLGFGSKTAIGYGRFTRLKDKTAWSQDAAQNPIEGLVLNKVFEYIK
jgi:CRISPR-associated protein Cmr6